MKLSRSTFEAKYLKWVTIAAVLVIYLVPLAVALDLWLLYWAPLFGIFTTTLFMFLMIVPLIAIWAYFSIVKKSKFNRYDFLLVFLVPIISFSPNMMAIHREWFNCCKTNPGLSGHVLASVVLTSINVLFFLILSNHKKAHLSSEVSKSFTKKLLLYSIIIGCVVNVFFPWIPLA